MRCGRVDKEKTDAVWHPFFCDPGGIQTRDLQNRNLTLYSAKLPGLLRGKSKHFFLFVTPIVSVPHRLRRKIKPKCLKIDFLLP